MKKVVDRKLHSVLQRTYKFRFMGRVMTLANWLESGEIRDYEIRELPNLTVGSSVALTRHCEAVDFTRVR